MVFCSSATTLAAIGDGAQVRPAVNLLADLRRQADNAAAGLCIGVEVVETPLSRLREPGDEALQGVSLVGVGERFVAGEEKAEAGGQADAIGDAPAALRDFELRDIGVPCRPGVDGAGLQRDRRIRGRQKDELDIRRLESVGFQKGEDELMPDGAAPRRDLLAEEIFEAMGRVVSAHDDREPLRNRTGRFNRLDRRSRGGGEGEGRVTGRARVDGASPRRLKQRRCGGELGPFDRVGQRFERARGLERDARVALLIADTKHCFRLRRRRAESCGDQQPDGETLRMLETVAHRLHSAAARERLRSATSARRRGSRSRP
jgi:hypothetical protein